MVETGHIGEKRAALMGPRENQESNVARAAPVGVTAANKIQLKLETRKSIKGARGMPWLSEAKKDVASCDKPGGGANIP